jgi:hypothetical protein
MFQGDGNAPFRKMAPHPHSGDLVSHHAPEKAHAATDFLMKSCSCRPELR